VGIVDEDRVDAVGTRFKIAPAVSDCLGDTIGEITMLLN
jgi:hypothetical protein